MSKIKYKKVLFQLLIGSFSVLVSSKTFASLTGNFKASKDSTPSDQRRTVSSGSRSSCKPSVQPEMLELFVPEQKVVHITSKRSPIFYVYFHTSQLIKFDFIFTDLSKNKPLYEKQVSINSAGVKSIVLPPGVKLEEETLYTWNLAIPCQNNSDRYQTVLSAGIKYSPNPTVTRQINNAKSKKEEIKIYAENGIWYEAIESAIKYKKQLGYKNHLQTFNTFFHEKQTN